jgi:hypothetical protein
VIPGKTALKSVWCITQEEENYSKGFMKFVQKRTVQAAQAEYHVVSTIPFQANRSRFGVSVVG